jgi:hypothetical protein
VNATEDIVIDGPADFIQKLHERNARVVRALAKAAPDLPVARTLARLVKLTGLPELYFIDRILNCHESLRLSKKDLEGQESKKSLRSLPDRLRRLASEVRAVTESRYLSPRYVSNSRHEKAYRARRKGEAVDTDEVFEHIAWAHRLERLPDLLLEFAEHLDALKGQRRDATLDAEIELIALVHQAARGPHLREVSILLQATYAWAKSSRDASEKALSDRLRRYRNAGKIPALPYYLA